MKLFSKFLPNSRNVLLTSVRKLSTTSKIEQFQVPKKVLNNGQEIPVIGLGTWRSFEDEARSAVTCGICCGYRMIDTAFVYQNEKFIGRAIQQLIKDKFIQRSDLFVITKLWNTYHRPEMVSKAIRLSLNNLELSYLDLYLMHWPMAYQEGNILIPRNSKGHTKFSDIDYVETWKAMEELQDMGLTRGIGLSNFNKAQIERVIRVARIKPAVLQCECHPFLNQKSLMDFCNSLGIIFMAYSPLGAAPTRPYAIRGEDRLLKSEEILKMAEAHNKTAAQILLRYQIQLGNIPIPGSANKSHIESNIKIFDWELTPCDMIALNGMNRNHRYVDKYQECGKHKHFPFLDEY